MATETRPREGAVTPRRLWFGLATSAFAWIALGMLDILIVWRTCTSFGHGVDPGGHEGGRAMSLVLSLILLAVAVTAGITSYRNWRALSAARNLLHADGVERREFMAILGVFISITLGMGIVWLTLGPLFITACQRAK